MLLLQSDRLPQHISDKSQQRQLQLLLRLQEARYLPAKLLPKRQQRHPCQGYDQ